MESALAIAYRERTPLLKRAKDQLEYVLGWVEACIEDRSLVRATVSNLRIKELTSLERKARDRRWTVSETFSECGDLVGGRVICNNVADVYRFVELLKERAPSSFEVQDYIEKPKKSGYRAVHVNFILEVSDPGNEPLFLSTTGVPCEVQIRTRLQDAWGELTHSDLYQENLPREFALRAHDLADQIALADKLAGSIRHEAKRVVRPGGPVDFTTVSLDGLREVFAETFGRYPHDYLVREAARTCEALRIQSLAQLPELLGDSGLRTALAETHQEIVGYRPSNEDQFIAALRAMAGGVPAARRHMKQLARRAFQEQEAAVTRELQGSLPRSLNSMLSKLEHHGREEPDIERWASALGAVSECSVCGTTIVDPDAFATAAVEHYGDESEVESVIERIARSVLGSSVEQGGGFGGSLCAYHREQAGKE
jgi:ppGpp synthetase/RelA/SpoT-type nucleotidyltranferase